MCFGIMWENCHAWRSVCVSVCVCVVVSGARDTAPMLMLADSALRTEERACANMYIYSHKHTHTHTRTHTHTESLCNNRAQNHRKRRERSWECRSLLSYTLYWPCTALTITQSDKPWSSTLIHYKSATRRELIMQELGLMKTHTRRHTHTHIYTRTLL